MENALTTQVKKFKVLFLPLLFITAIVLYTQPIFAREPQQKTTLPAAQENQTLIPTSPKPSPSTTTQRIKENVESLTNTVVRTVEEMAKKLNPSTTTSAPGTTSGPIFTDPRVYPPIDDLDPSQWEGGTAPYPDAPLCDDHNDTSYHGLWNKEKGCHYDHTHGYDPNKTIFKDIVTSWDQDISYPWQTNNENKIKHKGYVYLYTEAKNGCEFSTKSTAPMGCIRKILYQVHSIGTNMEVTTRFHSFRFVAEVCSLDQSQCGFIQGGGHTDYGVTHCPYKKAPCPKATDPKPLPNDNGILPELVSFQQPPYIAAGIIANEQRVKKSGKNTQFWNGAKPNAIVSGYYPDTPNSLFETSWSSLDGWTLLDPTDGYQEHFLCEDGLCKFNHSEFRIYSVRINMPPNADTIKNGFTNLLGHVDTSCTAASSTCATLVIDESVPTTYSSFFLNRQVNPLFAPELEFDICFNPETKEPRGCNTYTSVTSGWAKPQDMAEMMTNGMQM